MTPLARILLIVAVVVAVAVECDIYASLAGRPLQVDGTGLRELLATLGVPLMTRDNPVRHALDDR